MIPQTCDICDQQLTGSTCGCTDHTETIFHVRCFIEREKITGFGCPICDRESKEEEENENRSE